MGKRLLFINEKKSMVANALVSGLENAGFTVEPVRPNVTELSRFVVKEQLSSEEGGTPEIWLLYLQSSERGLRDVLSYIKDQVDEHHVRFYVIGTQDELNDMLGDFPRTSIKAAITRPFRADEVIDTISAEYANIQKIMGSRRILVVDDDATMLRTYKDMLGVQYRVYTANSGMNAIQMLANTEVDLILLDYEMPVIKGPQILEMLRAETHTKNIPVMFLTSKSDRDSIIQVMSLKPANYLLKSLPQAEIMGKISEFFDSQNH